MIVFTVTQIAVTGGSNSAVSWKQYLLIVTEPQLIGTYGTLVVGANGTYTYVADQDQQLMTLDAGDTATDSFYLHNFRWNQYRYRNI